MREQFRCVDKHFSNFKLSRDRSDIAECVSQLSMNKKQAQKRQLSQIASALTTLIAADADVSSTEAFAAAIGSEASVAPIFDGAVLDGSIPILRGSLDDGLGN